VALGTPNSVLLGGRYRLEREIGRGGMGVVWLGHDEVLGRKVALKRLAAEASRREAQIAARLHHPNLVAVFDLVDDPAEGRWLVMEYVEGTTLAGLVRQQGALPPDQVARLLSQLASGLAAAKAEGITHRDVKPSNVLVSTDGIAKLSDFGIARSTASDATMTQTGLLVGSPAYVAPEVAGGQRADHASDVWSLGATAYFLLAAQAPYDSGEAATALSTLYRIVHEEPPRLDGVGPLGPLLAHTLAKDPAHRWSVEQVQAFLRDGSLPPGSTQEFAPAGSARQRRPALLLAAAAVVLLAGVGGYAALKGGGDGTKSPAAGQHVATRTTTSTGATAAGMEAFIDSYVDAVSSDPAAAWTMLTPKFQRESGGFEHYVAHWESAKNGRVRSISADPATLVVRYQVHFAHYPNGPGPTILQLVHENGRYLIDGETTKGIHLPR
jgi:hypothetical protein